MAAVITAERICISVNPELNPVIQTITGWTISETRQTIVIGPISPSGRYWYRTPPIPNNAAGNATAVIISMDACMVLAKSIPKIFIRNPNTIPTTKALLNIALKIIKLFLLIDFSVFLTSSITVMPRK